MIIIYSNRRTNGRGNLISASCVLISLQLQYDRERHLFIYDILDFSTNFCKTFYWFSCLTIPLYYSSFGSNIQCIVAYR